MSAIASIRLNQVQIQAGRVKPQNVRAEKVWLLSNYRDLTAEIDNTLGHYGLGALYCGFSIIW